MKTQNAWTSQVAPVINNLPANARDVGSIPGSGRSLGGGHGNPLSYSCLENPMDRGAWRATVHGVTKNRTRLKQLSEHAHGAGVCTHLRHIPVLTSDPASPVNEVM